jgi:hypothetical protein
MDENKIITQVEGNRIDALSDRITKLMAEARNKVASVTIVDL